ncbi:hypothetical protein [Anaeromicropila populeti]|uniref:hypothetical protein n=1 Tax=Anaeromicropila populeti TaxID=37658 RepID=UPI000B83B206|nr:hypothetical protein [Anaeromicropila populeti]
MRRSREKYLIAFMGLLGIEVLIARYVHDTVIRPYIGDVLVVIVLYCLVRSRMYVLVGYEWIKNRNDREENDGIRR